MYYCADMKRRPITTIIEEIRSLLEKEGELSLRQLTMKTHTQWQTMSKALETMKALGIVSERRDEETKRRARLFRIRGSEQALTP